jgi:uncharacterized protein
LSATPTLADLRAFAVRRSLFSPTTLGRAISKLGFVQADPIRAPARAQDLTLRHRVTNYRAGDLEKNYPRLGVEEDFFVNYGYLPAATQALMHPRPPHKAWDPDDLQLAGKVLAFVRERGVAHPREVEAHFAQGRAANWFGGSSNVVTQLLDRMHYQGMVRVARRDAGTRVYSVRAEIPAPSDEAAALDALVDVIVHKYAPLPGASLGQLISKLMVGVPQWQGQRALLLRRAMQRLSHARVDGTDWYWPARERVARVARDAAIPQNARLLAPFDPVVWDRRRFELFWGWAYRFEAYTPAHKRKLGYYAMPLLWRNQVIGWGNVALVEGSLHANIGLAAGQSPRPTRELRLALDAEVDRMAQFAGVDKSGWKLIKA